MQKGRPLPRAVCSKCSERPRQKMASFYWAWFWPTGDRRSYKQLLDPVCAMGTQARIRSAMEHPEDCVGCRKRITGDPDVTVYATIYLPGRDRLDVDLAYDAACFEKEADLYSEGAQRLLNRTPPLEAGGPPPQDPWEDWSGIAL